MKAAILVTVMCFALALGGCAEQNTENLSYSTELDGQSAVITFGDTSMSAGEIEVGGHAYTFAYQMDGSLAIIYPDGYTYTQREQNGALMTPWDYNAETVENKGYIDAWTLAWEISAATGGIRAERPDRMPLIESILIAAVGVWMLAAPKGAWWLSKGWWYKDAEPSDLALLLYRVGGGVLVVMGVIYLLS